MCSDLQKKLDAAFNKLPYAIRIAKEEVEKSRQCFKQNPADEVSKVYYSLDIGYYFAMFKNIHWPYNPNKEEVAIYHQMLQREKTFIEECYREVMPVGAYWAFR